MKNLNKVLIVSLVTLLIMALLTLQPQLFLNGPIFPLVQLAYWLILLVWIILAIRLKFGSETSFRFAIYLFVIAIIFSAINIDQLAELALRLSVIGWIVGLVQAFIEYVRSGPSNKHA